jgi:protein subunit release factor A
MKDMACLELVEIEAKLPLLEREVKLTLLPKDKADERRMPYLR